MTTATSITSDAPAKKNGAAEHRQIEYIPIDRVRESPLNPRKTFLQVEELAADVKIHGVLQPITVRYATLSKGVPASSFEIVFGARRYRAAKLAGLAEVPCIVRELNDESALELMLIENVQRSDVHPLEEAEAYDRLHRLGQPVEDLAAKVGKTKAYVYGRMKLLALCHEAKKAYLAGQLTASTALLVARVSPPKLQLEVLKDFDHYGQDGPSARAAFQLIEGQYMLRLVDAPFDKASATLVPAAGSCAACPKRTGNQRELFSDVKSTDICTDKVCFAGKTAAHAKLEVVKLQEKGIKVLKGKDGHGGQMYAPDGFERLVGSHHDYRSKLSGKSFGEILKKAKIERPERIVYLDEKGKTVDLVAKSLVTKALRKLEPPEKQKSGSSKHPNSAEARKETEKDTLVDERLIDQLRTAVHKRGSTDAAWRFVIQSTGMLNNEATKAKGNKLVWLALDETIAGNFVGQREIAELAAAYGVDRKKIEKAVAKGIAEAAEAHLPNGKVFPMPKKDAKAVARAAKKLTKSKGKK